MKIHAELRGVIVSKFGSQEAFSGILDQPPSVVCDVLRGRRRLSPTAARKWAFLLCCHEEMLQHLIRESRRSQ